MYLFKIKIPMIPVLSACMSEDCAVNFFHSFTKRDPVFVWVSFPMIAWVLF